MGGIHRVLYSVCTWLKRQRNKAMTARLDRVAQLGCLVCGDMGFHDSPALIHHQLGYGRDDNRVIPLCYYHHADGGWGQAVHDGTKTWEAAHGTQQSMVDRVNILVPIVDME